ncbi:MAG: cell division protein SepF [Nitrososphaerota archaeon]|jgi:SepF-like predicted cell division protein (DUF552 family)|nr:cell division protein SepF [Nitrososphaerota archaeon]
MSSFGLFNKQKKQQQAGQLESAAESIQENSFNQTRELTSPPSNDGSVEGKVSEETPQSVSSKNLSMSNMSASSEAAIAVGEQSTLEASVAMCKTYLKAVPLRDLSDLEDIKAEIQNGNILILRITPLASKSVESVKSAVNELYAFSESIGGDIARLGEERVVICPKNIKIWREKMPEKTEVLPSTVA